MLKIKFDKIMKILAPTVVLQSKKCFIDTDSGGKGVRRSCKITYMWALFWVSEKNAI
jgi:hypothetical protein